MPVPFFYIPAYDPTVEMITLDEDASRHIVQVLRMKIGERLHLTDGKGHLLSGEIAADHKKHCTVRVTGIVHKPRTTREVTIAISLVKNSNRFEWFLEKATELGVTAIIPLVCARTEKEKFRSDRMSGICISAMLQSQQVWLPFLHEPTGFSNFIGDVSVDTGGEKKQLFIAHCEVNGGQQPLTAFAPFSNAIMAIGPEGDFTNEEIQRALQAGYEPVSLGGTRLRTETAAVVACTLLCLV